MEEEKSAAILLKERILDVIEIRCEHREDLGKYICTIDHGKWEKPKTRELDRVEVFGTEYAKAEVQTTFEKGGPVKVFFSTIPGICELTSEKGDDVLECVPGKISIEDRKFLRKRMEEKGY